MDIGLFRGLVTVTLLVLFIALCVWTWSRKRNTEFDAAAQLPLEDGEHPPKNNEMELGK